MKYVKHLLVILVITLPVLYTVFFFGYHNQTQTTVIYHTVHLFRSDADADLPLFEKKEFTAPLSYVILLTLTFGIMITAVAGLLWLLLARWEERRKIRGAKREERKERLYIEGIEYYFQGDLDLAEKIFERIKSKYPAFISPYIRIADIHYRRRDYRKSLDLLDQARVNEAKRVDIFLRKAENFLALDDLGEASAALERAAEIDPKNLTVLEYQRDLYIMREKWEEALAVHKEYVHLAKAKRPEMEEIQNRLQYEIARKLVASEEGKGKAIRALRDVIRSEPGFIPAYKLLGDIYVEQNRAEEALKMWEKAYKEHPEHPILLTWIEDVLYEAGNHEPRMSELYRKALQKSPHDRLLQLFHAHYLLRIDRPDEAETILAELERTGGRLPIFSLFHSEIYERKGRFKDALKTIKAACGITPFNQMIFSSSNGLFEHPLRSPRKREWYTWDRYRVNTGQALIPMPDIGKLQRS